MSPGRARRCWPRWRGSGRRPDGSPPGRSLSPCTGLQSASSGHWRKRVASPVRQDRSKNCRAENQCQQIVTDFVATSLATQGSLQRVATALQRRCNGGGNRGSEGVSSGGGSDGNRVQAVITIGLIVNFDSRALPPEPSCITRPLPPTGCCHAVP